MITRRELELGVDFYILLQPVLMSDVKWCANVTVNRHKTFPIKMNKDAFYLCL